MPGIYIHIPFCRNICNYCDFHHSASLLLLDQMVMAIEHEMVENSHFFGSNPLSTLDTLYFGGGTPSVCSIDQLDRLIDTARSIWGYESFAKEITLEANPEDLTLEYLDGLRSIGINRLSIGVQSFHAEHMEIMNRRHTPLQVEQSIFNARNAGFDNITIDLMYGLPFMTLDQWKFNLEQAIKLEVEHISAYHLTIEAKTVFGKKALQPVDDAISQLHFDMLRSALIEAGYEHYEVSNFARAGRRAIHNSNYWASQPYLGLGPSAHSYNGTHRRWNASANRPYLRGEGSQIEELSKIDIANETIMTRLRTADGLRLSMLAPEYQEQVLSEARKWHKKGYLQIDEQQTFSQITETHNIASINISIHPEYFLISDTIISDFFI